MSIAKMEHDSFNDIESEDLLQFSEFNLQCINENLPSQELDFRPELITIPSLDVPPTGNLPSQDNFEGPYQFHFSLDSSSDGKSCLYSEVLKQVFIKMNKILIVQFKTSAPLEQDTFFIRAMLMYNCSEYASLPVNRCTLHAIEDDPNFEAHKEETNCFCSDFKNVGHVIRSESHDTFYCFDTESKRHSVLTRVSRPQAGSNYNILIPYSFSCKSSCPRGMQRRPVHIIFTLENERYEVFGRRVLQVKICTCPKRDKERQEKDALDKNKAGPKQKRKLEDPNCLHHKLPKIEMQEEEKPDEEDPKKKETSPLQDVAVQSPEEIKKQLLLQEVVVIRNQLEDLKIKLNQLLSLILN